MLSPDKNFRMLNSTKTAMATMVNANERNEFKRLMINAQLIEEAAHRASLKSRDNKESNRGAPRGAVAPE